MFRFNFDVDETDDFVVSGAFAGEKTVPSASTVNSRQPREATSKEIPIEDLLSALPPTFSFSPLAIPLTSKRNVVVSRRDLFDARFQVIASDEDTQRTGGRSDLDFLDAPSDLVPGVYEGGLKTWECSLDLVDCLESIYEGQVARHLKGKRVLELGCGTAIPSLYLLQAVFFSEPSPDANIHIHLQDYNDLVLRLVTLPNVILAWYMSPASAAFRASVSTSQDDRTGDLDAEPEPLPVVDTTEPGELPVTPVLTSAFLDSLRHYGVHIRFFSGSWATFDVERAGGPYQILLTSETIYRTDGLPSLVELMWRATAMPTKPSQGDATTLADSTSRLSLTDRVAALPAMADEPYLCLVAAKLVYFGVGGGAKEFIEIVERAGSLSETSRTPRGVVRTVWERIHGVKRSVMRVLWAKA